MVLLSTDGYLFLLRWLHFLAGVTWIGLLYYFNFVQTPFFAETDPPVRSGAIQKLVPRALWWFRWGAMLTFLTGWIMILHKMGLLGAKGFFNTSYGWTIFLGGTLGTFMWANVWFVIWPAQKVVIASATQVAKGGQAIPAAAARGQRAGFTSRTNTIFSIPMLFFMGAASHLTLFSGAATTRSGKVWMALLSTVIILAIELNALVGTQGATKKPLATVKGALWAGFILTALFYVLFEWLF